MFGCARLEHADEHFTKFVLMQADAYFSFRKAIIMEQYDSRVDAYIDRSAPFAQPILRHLRQLVHSVSPLLTETIKWGFPFFDYKGSVCQMAAFKEHMGFGFWKQSQLNDPGKLIKPEDGTAGSFGKITSLSDLPSDEILANFIKQAILLNETGNKKTGKNDDSI